MKMLALICLLTVSANQDDVAIDSDQYEVEYIKETEISVPEPDYQGYDYIEDPEIGLDLSDYNYKYSPEKRNLAAYYNYASLTGALNDLNKLTYTAA